MAAVNFGSWFATRLLDVRSDAGHHGPCTTVGGVVMTENVLDDRTRLRMLECWLPLAQDTKQEQGWDCDSSTLEAIVLIALPALAQACNTVEARAILRRVYHLQQEAQR